ncbi:MAG: carboxypeptidase M32 [Rhodothermales bacterium]
MADPIVALRAHLAPIHDLNMAAAVLEWDQETYMPDGGADARARQVTTLRRLAHERFASEETGTLLDRAEQADLAPDSIDAALVHVTRRDYTQAVKLPTRLVAELAEAVSHAKRAWQEARGTDTFATFAPHLQRIVDLNIEQAECYGYAEQPYDALLDLYEPGITTAEVATIFDDVRTQLVPLVHALTAAQAPDASVLHRHFDSDAQWAFGVEVAEAFGYDMNRGRQDHSAHPFTTNFSINDVRLTTRIDEQFFSPGFFGTLHEAGHGMYEQGIDQALEGTRLAAGASLGVHESQSRLWENLVGRSRPFWDYYWPQAQNHFPSLADVDRDTFYRALNNVAASPIRVEADEVTYNLHIMLRFEIEQGLIGRTMQVNDLPSIWNDRMNAYLGIRPANDAKGVLQDIHWSLGAIGYFPTYALGNLMSVQLFNQARTDLGDLDAQIGQGEFSKLLEWLQANVHRFGRTRSAGEILHAATGQPLQAKPWLDYIRQKYSALYGLG